MDILKQITHAMGNVIGSFFASDMDVMSREARKILSNPEDREKYIKAVESLKESPNRTEKITLSNHETITLVS
ncbi:MAG: hypothetical protein JWQ25_1960 [Daejeonella sp.]|nr:hypothetical protein [Daejeonella sp.]